MVSAPESGRLAFIDNLRALVIVLVVSVHTAITYSNIGRWYYMEAPRGGPATQLAFLTYEFWLQAFSMGLLFLLAGYFVPGAFDRKGARRFLTDRALRLGAPALLYMLLIQPFNVLYLTPLLLHGPRRALGPAYVRYIASGTILDGTGPLWFVVALLIFSIVYACGRAVRPEPRKLEPGGPPGNREVMLLVGTMAACTFLVRLAQPIGTAVLNMQLGFFSQYVLLFAAGIYTYRQRWLLVVPYPLGICWFKLALIGGGTTWALLLWAGDIGRNPEAFAGGLHWQSAALCAWESLFGAGMCLGLTVLFRERWNRLGSMTRFLSGNAFAVYVFHAPVVMTVSYALLGFHAHPLVKFAVSTPLSLVAAFAVSALIFRRIPGLRRIL